MPSTGYATYRLKILLDNPTSIEKFLLISANQIFSASAIYLDGKLLSIQGTPGKSPKDYIPNAWPQISDFYTSKKQVELIIHVSNFNNDKAGIWAPITLGEKEKMLRLIEDKNRINLFILGTIVMLSLYHIALFLINMKNKSALYLAIIYLLTSFLHNYNSTERIITNLLGLNWILDIKFFYLVLYSLLFFQATFLHSVLPKEFNKLILSITQLLSVSFFLIALFTPSIIYTQTLLIFIIFRIAYSIYASYVIVVSIIKKRNGTIVLIIGNISYLLANIFIAIGNNLSFPIFIFITLCSLCYYYSLAICLAIRFSNSFSQVKNLSKKIKSYSKLLEKKVKKRTWQLEKTNKEKTRFFINLAHETKTPLTLIKNYLDKYIKKVDPDNDLMIITRNIDKFYNDMVNFLDVEKLKMGQINYNHEQIIKLGDILKNKIILFNETAIKKRIRIDFDIERDIFIKADPYAIDRIINNLIENSIKYTNNGGKINIILKTKNDSIILKIRDSGIGIDEKEIKNLFKPFYRLSHKKKSIQGIGMGLFIVKKIIDSLKGSINIESKLNKGTSFTITLQKHTLTENEKYKKDIKYSKPVINKLIALRLKPEEMDSEKKNIFIIDDNIEMLVFLQSALINEYNIFTANNGKEAMTKLKTIPKPDIIISDIMMNELDGHQFLKKLTNHEEYRSIPFIFITAKTISEEKLKSLKEGAIDYISKPFLIEELTAKIDSIIRNINYQKEKNIQQIEKKVLTAINSLKETKITNDKYTKLNEIYNKYQVTIREKEILQLMINGLFNKEISDSLSISIRTVENHIHNIYKKFKVQSRIELINLLLSLNAS